MTEAKRSPDLHESAAAFARTWAQGELADEVATALTCDEAEALAELFHAAGLQDAAKTWMDSHAAGDYPEDRHYRGREDTPAEDAPEPAPAP
ncbi:hypothetical protein [Actinomadura violacea]|uniref:Uncharacterized protein n=1 Tax=Actinomadura violacea TaxID=2819934 RepID=A0ABS3RXY4_9ACTN|nr:hypothetical protein [Actinomadura violacea]MBO2461567.1 hypothetical protein [Actinomadura violacea]